MNRAPVVGVDVQATQQNDQIAFSSGVTNSDHAETATAVDAQLHQFVEDAQLAIERKLLLAKGNLGLTDRGGLFLSHFGSEHLVEKDLKIST